MNVSYLANALNKNVAEASSEASVSLEQSKRSSRQTGKQPASGDTVTISDLARELFSTYQSSAPSRNDTPGATMKAITANGTEVTLEARSSGKKTFIMGQGLKAFTHDAHKKAYKTLTWNAQTDSAETLEYIATFKKTNGEISSFLLERNTAFTEDKDGNLIIRKADSSGQLTGTDENDILFNIEDNGVIDAGAGDDIILSMGKNAILAGGEGDDVITSMGDGAVIDGGAGDDAIAVLYDTLRHTMEQQEDDTEKNETKRQPYSQTVTVNGGDGNDDIMVRPEMFKSTIKGGEGDDALRLGNVTSSSVDAGNGRNTMLLDDVLGSTVLSGKGDDYVFIRNLTQSMLNTGDGDNKMLVDQVVSSSIFSGEGNDELTVHGLSKSTVMLGAGNDVLNAVFVDKSFVSGVEQVNALIVSNSVFEGVSENGFNVKTSINNVVNGHATGILLDEQDDKTTETLIRDRFITLEEKPEQPFQISQAEKMRIDYTFLLNKMLIQ